MLDLKRLSSHIPGQLLKNIDQQCRILTEQPALDINDFLSCFSRLSMLIRQQGLNQNQPLVGHFTLVDACRIYWAHKYKDAIPLAQLITAADDEEKASIVKALSELDKEAILLDIVIDLTRTNSVDLFAALALKNSYPAAHFPELHFNQLIMKALFSQLNIGLVIGLQERKNGELTRMAQDYKNERIAANRPVPDSLQLAL